MSKQPTSNEVSKRLEHARAECVVASEEVSAAQHVLEQHLLDGEKDLVVQRSQKLLADAKAKLAANEERVTLLERAHGEALARELGEERAAAIQAADELLAERTKKAIAIEKALATLAERYVEFRQLSIDVLAALPERLRQLPPLFMDQLLTTQLQIRLQALSGGKLPAPRVGLSVWESQQLPTIDARAAEERDLVMSQLCKSTDRRSAA